MDTNHQPQSITNHFLTQCPQENREILYRMIINLESNLFKETKHIQQINIHRNHLAHYLTVILLDGDQLKKHYTFSLTDEK